MSFRRMVLIIDVAERAAVFTEGLVILTVDGILHVRGDKRMDAGQKAWQVLLLPLRGAVSRQALISAASNSDILGVSLQGHGIS